MVKYNVRGFENAPNRVFQAKTSNGPETPLSGRTVALLPGQPIGRIFGVPSIERQLGGESPLSSLMAAKD
jgi:hypothetical protein